MARLETINTAERAEKRGDVGVAKVRAQRSSSAPRFRGHF
jgi:hypothetical protein